MSIQTLAWLPHMWRSDSKQINSLPLPGTSYIGSDGHAALIISVIPIGRIPTGCQWPEGNDNLYRVTFLEGGPHFFTVERYYDTR